MNQFLNPNLDSVVLIEQYLFWDIMQGIRDNILFQIVHICLVATVKCAFLV